MDKDKTPDNKIDSAIERAAGSPTTRPRQFPRKSFSRSGMPPMRMTKKNDDVIPPIGEAIRIIPLGGVEEIGKNMTMIEYKDDIIVVDMGFQFKDDDTPGVDYILPNTKYLEDRKDKIRPAYNTYSSPTDTWTTSEAFHT